MHAEPRSHLNAPAAHYAGERPIITSRGSSNRSSSGHSSSGSAPPKATGHDSVLRAIQNQGRTIHVMLMSGDERHGQLIARDKYTLTVRGEDGKRRIVFKHAIEEFYADEAPATNDE